MEFYAFYSFSLKPETIWNNSRGVEIGLNAWNANMPFVKIQIF